MIDRMKKVRFRNGYRPLILNSRKTIKPFVLILMVVLFSSCKKKTENFAQKTFNVKEKKEIKLDNNKNKEEFIYKNDTIIQIIKILYKNNYILYNYSVENITRKRSITFSGKAFKLKDKNGNMELGEDENGNAYTVEVYEEKNNLRWIRISIDVNNKNMLTVADYNNNGDAEVFTPINSVGILRK